MDFRLELNIKPWKKQLNLQDDIMLLGSCFTEHMAANLSRSRFNVIENPNGILFNPVSIHEALKAYSTDYQYSEKDLFFYDGLWQSWSHHGRFATPAIESSLQMMNLEAKKAASFLPASNWLIITLGSAFIYELKETSGFTQHNPNPVVSNCHKVPASHFNHRMLGFKEVLFTLNGIIETARSVNNDIKIIFTVSPVRHYREGLVENNRSKGVLLNAIGEVAGEVENVFYFPSYELIMDDLRDYRFYAEDLVHPNYFATQYVWEKFSAACIDNVSRGLMDKIALINRAMNHRPRQPESENHKAFMQKMFHETMLLKKEAPFLNMDDSLSFFTT